MATAREQADATLRTGVAVNHIEKARNAGIIGAGYAILDLASAVREVAKAIREK